METRERFVIEAFLGLILIVFLLLLVFLVIGISEGKEVSAETSAKTNPSIITNSYNTNTYNVQQQPKDLHTTANQRFNDKTYYRDDMARVYYLNSDYYNDDFYDDSSIRNEKDQERYLAYEDYSRLDKGEGIFGNDIDNYEVYVRNEDFAGGYFEVTFYMEDYYGRTVKNSEMHYIPALEEGKFLYKDVNPTRYEYRDWWYDVKPISKVPAKVYYESDTYYARNKKIVNPTGTYPFR
jgi:hypothetical protein